MMTKKSITIVQFPGSNCDQDCVVAFERYFGIETQLNWYQNPMPANTDGILIPGGFSFGDYLAAGSLAACSRIMEGLKLRLTKG